MKKLIFRNFAKDTMSFFLIMCLTIGIIVWTLQAVNYFDFVSEDGHGLKTYFSYIFLIKKAYSADYPWKYPKAKSMQSWALMEAVKVRL